LAPSKLDAFNAVNAKKSSNRPKRESTNSTFAEIVIERDLVSNIEPILNSEKAFWLVGFIDFSRKGLSQ